jgi:hypothetical protein
MRVYIRKAEDKTLTVRVHSGWKNGYVQHSIGEVAREDVRGAVADAIGEITGKPVVLPERPGDVLA